MSPELNIYCIPGLGADERLFQRLKLDYKNVKCLRWIKPHKNESLQEYVKRFSSQIDKKENLVLIGVSLGGIVAQELAAFLHPRKIILISSIKSEKELPWRLFFLRYIPLHRLVSPSFIKRFGIIARIILGKNYKEGFDVFKAMLDVSDNYFMKWALNRVVCWKSDNANRSVYHIHGSKDLVFPVKNIRCNEVIQEGNHFMVFNRADEVSEAINRILKS